MSKETAQSSSEPASGYQTSPQGKRWALCSDRYVLRSSPAHSQGIFTLLTHDIPVTFRLGPPTWTVAVTPLMHTYVPRYNTCTGNKSPGCHFGVLLTPLSFLWVSKVTASRGAIVTHLPCPSCPAVITGVQGTVLRKGIVLCHVSLTVSDTGRLEGDLHIAK